MFYVYLHKDYSGNVFYVGKGCGNRAWSKHGRNPYWKNKVGKLKYWSVEIVHCDLQEWAAFEIESDLIHLYGLKNTGDGELVNLSFGGGGNGGYIFNEKDVLKMCKANSGLNNGRSNKNLYCFFRVSDGLIENLTRFDFEQKYLFRVGDLFNRTDIKSLNGWCLYDNRVGVSPKHDPTVYNFVHKSGNTLTCNRRDFKKITNIDCKNLFKSKNKYSHVKGWSVIID